MRNRSAPWRPYGLLLAILSLTLATAGDAQQSLTGWAPEVFAGSELESYLRFMQISGEGAPYPWSIRAFSPGEVRRLAPSDTTHPWARRYRTAAADSDTALRLQIILPRVSSTFNSAFPFGGNNGPVWEGKGLTSTFSAGFSALYGAVSITVAPIAFWSQNADFEVVEHTRSETHPLADPRRPTQIDLPQRFGEGSFGRIDPGQTTLRVDVKGIAAGLSTANQVWGPAEEYPLLIGVNAPGFLHGFLGTSQPVNVWIGDIHGKVLWGRLDQSEFSPVHADSAFRFTTGVLGVFMPKGLPGLELGAARLFQMPWPGDGFGRTQLLAPFETFLKQDLIDQNEQELEASILRNQIVSVFARWAFPRSGFEFFAELASEDHRHNLRDLALQPDHATGYTLGFGKVWQLEGPRFATLRGELLNAAASHLHRSRRQEPFYVHAATRQGHTQRGQILGSPAAYGGGGSTLEAELYHDRGRIGVAWRRMVRGEKGEYLVAGRRDRPDVLHSLGVETLIFRGRWDLSAGTTAVYNFNRNFDRNVINLNATLGVRARW